MPATPERAVQIAAIRTYGESLDGFVKQYEEETNLRSYLLVDCSDDARGLRDHAVVVQLDLLLPGTMTISSFNAGMAPLVSHSMMVQATSGRSTGLTVRGSPVVLGRTAAGPDLCP